MKIQKQYTVLTINLVCWPLSLILLYVSLYIKHASLEDDLKRANETIEMAKQALSDERLSRYLECGDRPICDERWPDAAKTVAEAKAKVKAEEEARALRKKREQP